MANKKENDEIVFGETVRGQGVEETIIPSWELSERAAYSKNMHNQWSFWLKDGTYAFLDYDKCPENKKLRTYYHRLSIDDEEYRRFLTYWDRQEENAYRRFIENESYDQQNYYKRITEIDEDADPAADPSAKEFYMEWARDVAEEIIESADEDRKFPQKAEYGVIQDFKQKMTGNDWRVYRYLFDSELTEEEIKKEYKLEHSTWSNEKIRFLDRVRRLFVEMGYDVPSAEELKDQRDQREAKLKQIAEAEEEERSLLSMGKSMARELALIESQEHASTYASEDQRLREDYAQMLADDRDQLRKKNVRKKCAQNVKSNV